MKPAPKRDPEIMFWQVRLNSQGYDKRGTYYGVGMRVYTFMLEDGAIDQFRALDRQHAREILTARYPNHRILR